MHAGYPSQLFITRSGERLLVLPPKKKDEPDNSLDLFEQRRTASPEEKDTWLESALELALAMNEVWPSDLYEKCAVLPYSPNWWGALFHQLGGHGYRKCFSEHRTSRTMSANGRVEFKWERI